MEAVWDRQLRIEGWKQDKVTATVALCVGLTDIGCAVAMGLCRMGVGRVVLLDEGTVAVEDLSASPLFAMSDVGRPRVDAAVDGLQLHNIATEIETSRIDHFQEWLAFVALARRATIIFNTVSAGDYCDLAVQSLALKLGIPVVQAGTLSNFQLVDCYAGQGKPCMNCVSEGLTAEVVATLAPDRIETVESVKKFATAAPEGNLTVCTAGIAGMLMVAQLGNMLIADPELKLVPRFVISSSTMEAVKFPVEANANCAFCGHP